MACCGDRFTFLYVDDVRTSQEAHLYIDIYTDVQFMSVPAVADIVVASGITQTVCLPLLNHYSFSFRRAETSGASHWHPSAEYFCSYYSLLAHFTPCITGKFIV
jgi:hypothetical protein